MNKNDLTRRQFIAAASAGSLAAITLIIIDAAKKPSTNLGKRSQITPALTAFFCPDRSSQKRTEAMERRKAQMPIQISRPITFIKVKV